MMMGWDYGWGWTMMFGGFIVWAGLLVLLVWLLPGIVRPNREDTGNQGAQASPRKTSLEILQERYAKGEISREEYLTTRQDLGLQ